MNFNEVYKKIAQIDGVLNESVVQECGEPMGMPAPSTPSTPPVSMSVNINAQGIDNIKSMMDLWTKVNPDMMPKVGNDLPHVGSELTIGGPGVSVSSPADDIKKDMTKLISLDGPEELDDESAEPEDDIMTHLNKELKPFDDQQAKDKEEDEGYDPERMKDGDMAPGGAGAGDISKDDDQEKDEAYANEPDEMNAGVDAVTHDGNDLNKSKKTFPKVNGGDNPMQRVKEELAAALAAYKAQ